MAVGNLPFFPIGILQTIRFKSGEDSCFFRLDVCGHQILPIDKLTSIEDVIRIMIQIFLRKTKGAEFIKSVTL